MSRIIVDGTPTYGTGEMVGDFPIYIPTVSVTSIGDGGGSIAAVSEFGVLTVQAESAGSAPGPACWPRRHAAHHDRCVRGLRHHRPRQHWLRCRLRRRRQGSRRRRHDRNQARARPRTGRAEAVIQVAVSGMYREVGKLASRQGIDPRDFTLLAFGGAGPDDGVLPGARARHAPGADPGAGRAVGAGRAGRRREERLYQHGLLSAVGRRAAASQGGFDRLAMACDRLDHRGAEVRRVATCCSLPPTCVTRGYRSG